MGNRYSDIDVMTFVQGNTARKSDLYRTVNYCGHNSDDRLSVERNRCVVYDFRREAAAASRPYTGHGVRAGRANSLNRNTDKRSDRRTVKRGSGKKAARARARRIFAVRTALFAFLVLFTMFGIGGIASRAKSREVHAAYKYYDTITVGYQENLLDIVERYDDRDHYETQIDYVEELCRINNLAFDGTAYPAVTPGTHLVVPYYSTELK